MIGITALLLDRDGTLIKDKHYLSNPDGVELLPGVGDALGALAKRGVRFYLVSNQSGIGRGYFTTEAAIACNQRLAELLAPFGVRFTEMRFCPHRPEDRCECRKPAPGMWHALQQRHGLNPKACVMVGDKAEDMVFADNAGLAMRVLVLTGKGWDTAQGIGISVPSRDFVQLDCVPAGSSHPHLTIPDFSQLLRGLDLAGRQRGPLCGE